MYFGITTNYYFLVLKKEQNLKNVSLIESLKKSNVLRLIESVDFLDQYSSDIIPTTLRK